MNYKNLKWKQKAYEAHLTISRPSFLNALNSEVFEELEHCLSSLDTKKIRVLIVKGDGDKAFVAGADIKEMSSFDFKKAQEFSQKGQKTFSLFEKLPLPVIALIQGFALGGGLELALACDILILDEKGKIGFPEVKLGLFPSFAGTQRLTHAVGPYKAKEMIFSGNFYSASQAYNMGLVQRIASKEKLMMEAQEYSKTFQERGPLAIAKAKKLIQHSRNLNLETLKLESQNFASLFSTKDTQEGLLAFLEKRKAEFKGI